MIDFSRLQAPRESFGVLVEPRRITPRPVDDRALGRIPILDQTVKALRDRLRKRLELAGPVVVTGHQSEFIHAGVFAKNVAVEHLCRKFGGSAVFLAVDSDQLKHRDLIVPQVTSVGLRRVAVPFSDAPRELPCEWLDPQPREHWLDFFARVASLHEGYDESLLRAFSNGWLAGGDPQGFCASMARGIAAVERELELESPREFRISEISATPEFLAFVSHLMLNAGVFAQHYNAAQLAYRQRFRIRSPYKPVPQLDVSPQRIELPFWISRVRGTRGRMYIATGGDSVDVYSNHELAGRLPRSAVGRIDAMADLWSTQLSGWHVRPRALTLSCFARLFLADLFIHGIGGGRYDAMTDDFAGRFFDVDLPPIACVTATLHLPLPRSGVDRAAVLAARHAARDIRFNPQRHVRAIPQVMRRQRDGLLRRGRALRDSDPGNHAARRTIFTAIRDANDRMLEVEPWRTGEMDRKVESLEQQMEQDRVARDREYFFALHRKSDLRRLIAEIRQSLAV